MRVYAFYEVCTRFFCTFNDPHFRVVMVDWENYASALTAKFRQLYSRSPDSKALFEVYSAVKDDPVFKQTWGSAKGRRVRRRTVAAQRS